MPFLQLLTLGIPSGDNATEAAMEAIKLAMGSLIRNFDSTQAPLLRIVKQPFYAKGYVGF